MLRIASRTYQTIPRYTTRLVDNLHEHINELRKTRPSLVAMYFKNDWNPQCSASLEREYLDLMKYEPFISFVVDGSMGGRGERIKKYYDVMYEPSMLILSDGMELIRLTSGEVEDYKEQVERAKKFRATLRWGDYGFQQNDPRLWEDFHS